MHKNAQSTVKKCYVNGKAKMIYVDMKCVEMKKNIDLRFDESIKVNELLREIGKTFGVKEDKFQVASVNRKCILNKNRSFSEQGVLGGDTLILIES